MKSSAMHGESGYERIQNDAYWTPSWCVSDGLLTFVTIKGKVWEPAAGNGNICKVLHEHRIPCVASDIRLYDYPLFQKDFFSFERMPFETANIITNPPYEDAERFIRHALGLTTETKGVVAMLLRNEYDSAKSRRYFWRHPFDKKIVLTKRPRWSDSNKASPRHNFAWFVWDWSRDEGPPTMEWAP